MADIFDEVDSALQREKVTQFWSNHGNALIGIMLAVVIGVGVNNWWQQHERAKLEVQSAQLLEVLLPVQGETIKPEQAQATLKNLQANGDKQLDVLAALQLASRYEQDDKIADAIATLKPLMTRRYTEKVLSDLATVQYVRLQLTTEDGAKQTDELNALLKPVAEDKRAFRFTARELQGLILQQQGKTKEATALFTALAADETAPATLRERAQAYIVTAESQH